MTVRDSAPRDTGEDPVTEIRAILNDYPDLLETLPPVERAVAEALTE